MKHWTLSSVLAALLCIGWAGTLTAEQIKLPLGQQTDSSALDLPQRGLTRAQVAEQLGEPETVQLVVGEPPISAWEYQDFTVYFEHDLVLRSVVRHPNLSPTPEDEHQTP